MDFITSRGFPLPSTADALAEFQWFNLWSKRFWPYTALEFDDHLLWYESASKSVVWHSRVSEVVRFEYKTKAEIRQKLRLNDDDASQPYFTNAPTSGYCLAYKVADARRVNVAKPDTLRIPQLGWLQVDEDLLSQWPGIASVAASRARSDLGLSNK